MVEKKRLRRCVRVSFFVFRVLCFVFFVSFLVLILAFLCRDLYIKKIAIHPSVQHE
jgi:hypothetical protein